MEPTLERGDRVGAVVLAAGMSIRMGQPKLIMPWGDTTVIGHVAGTLAAAGLDPVLVVAGAYKEEISEILADLPMKILFNPNFMNGEMLESLKVGLTELPEEVQACLMVLGDQPQILASTVHEILNKYRFAHSQLIIPSYQYRRGHPWLIARSLWDEIQDINPPETLRDFLGKHAGEIEYLNLDTPTILQDLDTPEDYQKYQPAG